MSAFLVTLHFVLSLLIDRAAAVINAVIWWMRRYWVTFGHFWGTSYHYVRPFKRAHCIVGWNSLRDARDYIFLYPLIPNNPQKNIVRGKVWVHGDYHSLQHNVTPIHFYIRLFFPCFNHLINEIIGPITDDFIKYCTHVAFNPYNNCASPKISDVVIWQI